MISTLRSFRHFLLPFTLWIVAGSVVIFMTDKEALHVGVNQFHHPIFDVFFKYTTYLGDGIFGAFIVLLGFVYRIRYGVIGLIGLAGSGLLTQLLKRQVFGDHFRPSAVLKHLSELHYVDGVELHAHFSFPSGHSTAAFAIFLLLAFIARDHRLQMLCFFIGLTVAFSRVYISQHFFEDIFVGSIIGTAITLLAIHFLQHRAWGEKGLVEIFDRS